MGLLVVMLLVGAVVCALFAALASPSRPQMLAVAIALFAGASLTQAAVALHAGG